MDTHGAVEQKSGRIIRPSPTLLGVLLALLTGLAWGTNGVSVKLIQGFSSAGLSTVMLGTAFVVMLLNFLAQGRGAELLQPAPVRRWLLLLGVILGVQFLFSMASYQLALASNAALFNQMTPVFVVALKWLGLHERIDRKTLMGIGVAAVGASLVVGVEEVSLSSEYFVGDLMAIVS
ncbi:MAG: DMT family transporter, partial [Actinobacteria bacterium]|nr:DMT family transporter [Actinomycetota bacterium]